MLSSYTNTIKQYGSPRGKRAAYFCSSRVMTPPSGRAPFIRMTDRSVANALHHWRRVRIQLLRPRNRFALRRLYSARRLGTGTLDGVVSLRSAFDIQLVLIHGCQPIAPTEVSVHHP